MSHPVLAGPDFTADQCVGNTIGVNPASKFHIIEVHALEANTPEGGMLLLPFFNVCFHIHKLRKICQNPLFLKKIREFYGDIPCVPTKPNPYET
jgi:hypothetical protein